jgi:hypothetical protein
MKLNEKTFLVALLVMAVGIGLVNVFLMPPFMNPDEIQHFMFSADYAYNDEQLKELDRGVLQLLKDHKWFHFIGVGPGWEDIEKIEDIYFLHYFSRRKVSVSRSYFHFLYGKILKYSGVKDTLPAFYLLRMVSFFIYMGIFVLALFFYKAYFPGSWYFFIAGHLLIFQPSTILNSVNYDVLLTFLGVLFFIFAYRFLVTDEKRNLVFLILLAASASLVKTGGILFFIYFFILLMFKYKVSLKFLKRVALAVFLFVIVFSWFNYWFPERFFTLYTVIFSKLHSLTGTVNAGSGTAAGLGFFDSILDSFFFHTGWMAFKLSKGWYIVLKLFLLVSVVGVIAGVSMKKLKTAVVDKKWLVYALIVIFLQTLMIRLYYGTGLMAQGRYLYPLIIPIMTLIYCGLLYVEKHVEFKRNYLVISYIVFLALFFLLALIRVVSVFYLEIPSPHPGL